MNSVVKIEHKDVNAIPYQEASLDIWEQKYRLTAKDGTPIDDSMDDTYKRVARALADVERLELREIWYERFLWALRHGAIPAGPRCSATPARSTTSRPLRRSTAPCRAPFAIR